MKIGGTVDRTVARRLLEVIEEQGPEELKIEEYITFEVADVTDGVLTDLINFCCNNGISYQHCMEESNGYDGYMAWHVVMPDGTANSGGVPINVVCHPVVEVEER